MFCAPWEVGCAPANAVRGMQMRVGKLPAHPGKLAVCQLMLSAACKCGLRCWLCALGSWLYASKRCPRHANAAWEVGCAPTNVVRGMQMRSGKLAVRPGKPLVCWYSYQAFSMFVVHTGKLAVRQQTLSAACKCGLGSWLRAPGSWLRVGGASHSPHSA